MNQRINEKGQIEIAENADIYFGSGTLIQSKVVKAENAEIYFVGGEGIDVHRIGNNVYISVTPDPPSWVQANIIDQPAALITGLIIGAAIIVVFFFYKTLDRP